MNEKKLLVGGMKRSGVLKTKAIEEAFLEVERELFVLPEHEEHAYADTALPIGCGQTISQPTTIAVMLEMLEAKKGHRVLEAGSGCGYVLALLSKIVGARGKVFGLELEKTLAERSKGNLEKAGAKNAKVYCRNGYLGLEEEAPFDRVLVSAACRGFPEKLFGQLKEKGVGVAPVGERHLQRIASVERAGERKAERFAEGNFVFVPFREKQ